MEFQRFSEAMTKAGFSQSKYDYFLLIKGMVETSLCLGYVDDNSCHWIKKESLIKQL